MKRPSRERRIIQKSEGLKNLTDAEITARATELRWQVRAARPIKAILENAAALVREASRRVLGLAHYPVQVAGGIAVFEGKIIEMQTGEGKTLTAVLPAFLRALPGQGCHVLTANDYLATRDAKSLAPVFHLLGLTVGCVHGDMEDAERRENYARDITYGTATEMGFDFLRDRIKIGAKPDDRPHAGWLAGKLETQSRTFENTPDANAPVQRGHYFALVDEADSILIDDARTPLIIGLQQTNRHTDVALYRWSQVTALNLQMGEHFAFGSDRRSLFLTDAGCDQILLMPKTLLIDVFDNERIFAEVERAITAQFGYELDRDYIIQNDEIVIVDESTGRIMEGRKWQDGLHQAVEAKERLPITSATGQAARISVQSYFRQYSFLGGMTGTALPARKELKKTYGLKVRSIPTNRPCLRKELPPRIFATIQSKREAIVEVVHELQASGRSVLIGTPSVEASEALGELLVHDGIAHRTLNAKHHQEEAEIIAQAGKPARVTIATNMAGRGTDILLDDTVRKAGGLHVIATEMHSSYRIDRQLTGRAARQGDPGSFQFFLSLDDELLSCRPAEYRSMLRKKCRSDKNGELPAGCIQEFRKAQRMLERQFQKSRKQMLQQEKERTKLYEQVGLDPWLELTE